jgi:hypothetical protein
MVFPEVLIPPALRASVLLLEMPLPDVDEIGERVRSVWVGYTAKPLPDDALGELTLALKGLTLDEVSHVMHRVLATGRLTRDAMLTAVGAAKKAAVSGAAFLDYVPDWWTRSVSAASPSSRTGSSAAPRCLISAPWTRVCRCPRGCC